MEKWLIVGVFGIAFFFIWRFATKKKAGNARRRVGVVVARGTAAYSAPRPSGSFAVLLGLVKAGVAYLVYLVVVGFMLPHAPPIVLEWWMAFMLLDLLASCFVWKWGLPKDYWDNKDPNNHTPLDYVVGLVLTVYLVVGMGYHMMVLFSLPGVSLNP